MASIENRSRHVVVIEHNVKLRKTFSFNREKELHAYMSELKKSGVNFIHFRLDDKFAVRQRKAGQPSICLYASSEEEARKLKLELETRPNNTPPLPTELPPNVIRFPTERVRRTVQC